MELPVRVFCPIYIFTSSERCWKCGQLQSVIALGARFLIDDQEEYGNIADTDSLILLNYITLMPKNVFDYISKISPRYIEHYSHTAGESYYANTCECGANFGDFYLFSKPTGAFFPITSDMATAIRYHQLPFQGELPFECSWSEGSGELILQYARNESLIMKQC